MLTIAKIPSRAILTLVLACGACAPIQAQTVPNFTLKDTQGRTVSLGQFRGKVVLMHFWASWCPDCLEALPLVEDIYTNLSPRGLAVLGINSLESERKVAKFAQGENVPYPELIDEKQAAARFYGVQAVPSFLLIGPDGTLLWKKTGYDAKIAAEMVAKVQAAINQKR